jgi:hypothetical protein
LIDQLFSQKTIVLSESGRDLCASKSCQTTAVVVIVITNEQSFQEAADWLSEFRDRGQPIALVVCAATRIDLIQYSGKKNQFIRAEIVKARKWVKRTRHRSNISSNTNIRHDPTNLTSPRERIPINSQRRIQSSF